MSGPSLVRAVARTGFHSLSHLLARTSPTARRRMLACLPLQWIERRLPSLLMLEVTNACNLHCPLCPVGAGVMTRKRGFMALEGYRAIIGEVSPFVSRIIMNFAGEPLLHPDIGKMVSIATEAGIAVTLGTNGTIDKAEELLQARPAEILYALDGVTPESVTAYRRGAEFARVLRNLDILMTERAKRKSPQPRVVLQFVVMRRNEAEIPRILDLARDFGVDEVSLVPVIVNNFFGADHGALLEEFLPTHSAVVQYERRGDEVRLLRPGLCNWAFQSTILYNGDVAICCFDYDGQHIAGNVFRDGGFAAVWRGARYHELRRGIISQSLPLCLQCGFSSVKPEQTLLLSSATGPAAGMCERWIGDAMREGEASRPAARIPPD